MYTHYDWHLARELLLLLVFCLFVCYAILIGAWQDRQAKLDARRMTAKPEGIGGGHKADIEPEQTRREDGFASRPASHAA